MIGMARIMALIGCILTLSGAQIAPVFQEAERLYGEGSYRLAHEAYLKIKREGLSFDDRRWLELRLADTLARSEASTARADDSELKKAEDELRQFVQENALRDRVWAEAQETLADVQRDRRGAFNLGGAWPHYEKALEYWAGSTNLTLAADKYWSILRKAAEPPRVEPMWYYGAYGTQIPLGVLENALKIARTEDEKARAHFMIAMTLRSQGREWEQRFRIPQEFEAALKLKKDTRWYDDALYFYGEWMSSNGRAVQDEGGNWRMEADYEKALELFRRLAAEFRRGETPWFDDAQNRIRDITRADIQVSVANVFLPESEIEFHLSWRNVDQVKFTLYKLDLTANIKLGDQHSEWLQGFTPRDGEAVRSWEKKIEKRRPYTPGNETVRLEKLPRGAYVLMAKAGEVSSRELLLVSDASVVLQTLGSKAVVYVCDAGTGAPLPSAKIAVWERYYDRSDWHWTRHEKTADKQGLADVALRGGTSHITLFATAKAGDRQAFSQGGSYVPPGVDNQWKIYAFPDKPAYRPGEKVHWKIIARRQRAESYALPSGEKLVMRVTDPRGAEASKEIITLNSFGSAWGAVELKSDFALGEYQAVFFTADEKQEIGRAVLFRLEEYKLPEFKVAIKTPEQDGRKKAFVLGESVSVDILAEYYFGGPVANANVEIVLHQSPLYHIWIEPREFEWFYTDRQTRPRRYNPGQVVQREALKTDAEGKARFEFKTPFAGNDLEYRIEARVTDSSRREIVANDTVRVGRQRFYVHPKPSHRLYKPQDKVDVEFRLADANDQPLAGEGTVRVTRDFWFEIWLAPDGREVQGDELRRLQDAAIFPPPAPPAAPPWRLKFRGYQQDHILTRTLKAGTNGLASLTFTPEREGYYRVAWRTDEEFKPGTVPGRPVLAETTVWVATTRSADLGYRSGGLEILVDKDTFRAGQKAAVMLSAPTNDRYVLLTTSGSGLLDYQLVHLTGSVKLLELDVDEKHVPNFFMNAVMVADEQMFTDQEEIIVPPTKNFLTVELSSDRTEYKPGDKGVLRVRTHDDSGKPVSAEVALSVFDESVTYIQSDVAGDPRQFFFGTKRPALLSSSSSFNYRSYRRIVDGQELDLLSKEKDEAQIRDSFYRPERFGRARLQGGTAPAAAASMAENRFDFASASADKAGPAQNIGALLEMKVTSASAAPEPEEGAVQVRTDFRSALFWEPDLKTDENGRAEVSFNYPDSLTSWKAVARAVSKGNRFGIDDDSTRTKQPLIVRLQAPRFFLVGDTVTVSAVINNNTDEGLTVSPELQAAGIEVEGGTAKSIGVAAGAEARVDWIVRPRKPGEIKLKVAGRAGHLGDAMEKTFTVYEHGIEKFLAISGKSRGDSVSARLELPEERKSGSARFTVQVTPSLAVTMLDALPYLIDYPYGCTEQTMSRFLPSIITAKTLKDLGLDPEDAMSRVFGGIEPGTTAKTQPAGKKSLDRLGEMTGQGLDRLYQFQHADGGWGWWKEGESDPFMTAYVFWGLSLAKAAGTTIDQNSYRQAAKFLNDRLVEAERNYDLQAFILHALSSDAEERGNLTSEQQTAFENLWEHRDRLNAYTRALFALAAHSFKKDPEAKTLIRNLANGVTRDEQPGQSALAPNAGQGNGLATAHWGEDGIHWRWSEGGVEATAFALRALLAIDPKNELVEPVANWLIKNRRGAQWSNTRDTAIVLLALNDYLRVTGEIKGELGYEVIVNGTTLGTRKISGPDILSAPEKFVVPAEAIRSGSNEIRIRRTSGEAPIYFAAECVFFSQEEPILPAGNEIFVRRHYYRLTPVPTLLKGFTYEKQELSSGDKIESGERIETVITIDAKNNYEYLVFEDLKPAGAEAVEVRSGQSLYAHQIRSSAIDQDKSGGIRNEVDEPLVRNDQSERETGQTRWVYQELRDRKVALFIDKLPQGFWEIRYEARAEIPGEFHALPVVGHAMYVPEIRGNSGETTLVIEDGEKSPAQ